MGRQRYDVVLCVMCYVVEVLWAIGRVMACVCVWVCMYVWEPPKLNEL